MTILNFAVRALFLHFRGGIHLNWLNTFSTWKVMLEQCLGAKDVKGKQAALRTDPTPPIHPGDELFGACCMINSYICSALSDCAHSYFSELSHCLGTANNSTWVPHRRSSPGCLCSSSYAAGHRVAAQTLPDLWRGPAYEQMWRHRPLVKRTWAQYSFRAGF